MALSVVDAHVREKLIWLRQQQEDMTILLSQVSTACLHCEKTLQQVYILNVVRAILVRLNR
jgi:tripartite motif-containing protein 23